MNKNGVVAISEIDESLDKMLDDPEYWAKIEEDEKEGTILRNKSKTSKRGKRPVARVRNHQFTHKQWRRFLSYYPPLDVNKVYRLDGHIAIYIGASHYDEETDSYYYWHMNYSLNFYNHLFISPRGDLRVLRGKIEVFRHDSVFATGRPSLIKSMRRRTNRFIRHMPLSENDSNSWNYYRKRFIEDLD